MKITATIITLNEEKNIADCLASLDFVDEIVVVDSGSTDRTEEICRSHPKLRFVCQEWLGYGKQKNRAAELAVNDIILNVDADERVSDQLRKSILTADFGSADAFRVARENYFGKCWIRHCGWYPDYTTRLYDRRNSAFNESSVHESLQVAGSVETLAGHLVHYTYRDISDYLARMDRYSTLAAEEYQRVGRKAGVVRMFVSPIVTFLKMYIVRLGFLDGHHGLVLSMLYAFYTFCKYAKLSAQKVQE